MKKRKLKFYYFVATLVFIFLVFGALLLFLIARSEAGTKSFQVGDSLNVKGKRLKVNSVKIVDTDTCVGTSLRDVIVNVDYKPGLDKLYAKLEKDDGSVVPDGAEHGNQADGMHFKFNGSNYGWNIEDRSYRLELIDGKIVHLIPFEYQHLPAPDKAECDKVNAIFNNSSIK